MGSDELYTWVLEGYELTDDNNDVVKLKDLCKEYAESALFCNLSKAEKRMNGKKQFSDNIKNHIAFKRRFKENKARETNGIQYMCERLHRLKKKEYDDSDDDEGADDN